MSVFIGQGALEEIAKKYSQDIAMSGAYYRPDVFDRLKIKVEAGLQFKSIKHVMNRKGHTTTRKEVGVSKRSSIGYAEPRELTTYQTWDFFVDNKDNYREEALFDVSNGVDGSYPASELAFKAIITNYGENLFDCLWHGDASKAKTDTNAYLRLYDGFITYLTKDVTAGRISTAKGNLVSLSAIAYPTGPTDNGAWLVMKAFRTAWSQNLKNAPEVLVYCNGDTAMAIAKAFANDYGNNNGVIYQPDGSFKFPLWSNVRVCPEDSIGTGYKLIATTPYNFEYGCDTLNDQSMVSVRVGSDNDHNEISWQIQSAQGTRVLNVNASNFCMSDAALTAVGAAGDYKVNTFTVTANDTTNGEVKVNDATPDNTKDYPAGTILTLKASVKTASASTHEFVKWSNGKTDAEITVVTTGMPESIIATFAAKG